MTSRHKKAKSNSKTAAAQLGCIPKVLPPHLAMESILTAAAVDPSNMLRGTAWSILPPAHIALLTPKYWGAKGVDLGVKFLDTNNTTLKNKILAYANKWGNFGNIRFREASSGEVRISLGSGGYWSYLGTDILSIPKSQQTMNLEGFSTSTPDSEYDRVVCHEFGHCLDGDTLIDCPRDLTKYPRGIPIRELVGQTPNVYAWADGRIVIRKASRVWLSKRSVATVRVKLGTGQGGRRTRKYLPPLELVGTPDHPVLLADGVTWKNLGDLRPGDRLCSLYRDSSGDRSRIRWTGGPDRIREHVFVASEIYGPRPTGYDCHHRNENKLDQSPDNLEWKEEFLHVSDHFKGKKRSPEAIAATVAYWTGRKHRPESRRRMSETKRANRINHTVQSVEPAGIRDVYDMTVPGADSFIANGVVVHNSLGFPHEHERQEIIDLLDVEKTVKWFADNVGWDRQTVMQQVFEPLDPATLKATASDVRSIMCYQFAAACTKSGQPIPGGDVIDTTDSDFASSIYPKAVNPPPPPGPNGGGNGGNGGTLPPKTSTGGVRLNDEQVSFTVNYAAGSTTGIGTCSGTRHS